MKINGALKVFVRWMSKTISVFQNGFSPSLPVLGVGLQLYSNPGLKLVSLCNFDLHFPLCFVQCNEIWWKMSLKYQRGRKAVLIMSLHKKCHWNRESDFKGLSQGCVGALGRGVSKLSWSVDSIREADQNLWGWRGLRI